MIKAWFKRKKIKVELEQVVGDWELKHKDETVILEDLTMRLEDRILDEILRGMEYEITDRIKERMAEVLSKDKAIQAGIDNHLADKIKDMLRHGY